MGAVSEVGWGPAALVDVVRDQLSKRSEAGLDSAQCARLLAASTHPAERAERFADLGGCHFLAGNVSGALAAWRQASVSGHPTAAARALYNLGLFHEEIGLGELAVEQYLAAQSHQVEPYDALASMATARASLAAGEHDAAIEALASTADRLAEHDPGSPLLGRALLGSGDVAEHMRDFDRAARAYRAALGVADETIRSRAGLALIRVLRFVGRDDEAQQVVDEVSLADVDPAVAVERVELLVRLNRVEEAAAAIDGVASDGLSVPDRFRLVSTLLELGLVNRAIDDLETLSHAEAPETRTRAVYLLGEVYLAHQMYDPARTMLESVDGIQSGYWSDKASLALGDLAFALEDVRGAAAHWADAAASSVESVAAGARHRLVEALEGVDAAMQAGQVTPPASATAGEPAMLETADSTPAATPQTVDDAVSAANPDLAASDASVSQPDSAPEVQRVALRRRDPAPPDAMDVPLAAEPRWREDFDAPVEVAIGANGEHVTATAEAAHGVAGAHVVSLRPRGSTAESPTAGTPGRVEHRRPGGAFSKFT